jgi:hypothetical protein
MRDGEVWLPLNAAKEGMLLDLDCFGFEDVDPHKIHGGSSNMAAARHLIKCKEEHEKFLSICMENVKAAKTTSKHEAVACECFVRISRGDSLKSLHFSCGSEIFRSVMVAMAFANQAEFGDHLAKHGLESVGSETNRNGCFINLKEKKDTSIN